jgi:transcriptional regulator NrdR family protein
VKKPATKPNPEPVAFECCGVAMRVRHTRCLTSEVIRRYRHCVKCGQRIVTVERPTPTEGSSYGR